MAILLRIMSIDYQWKIPALFKCSSRAKRRASSMLTRPHKYLSKNNFIFIPEILEDIFYVVNQMPPTFIGIESDPLILHKTPQYLNTIQFWSIFWKIKDIEAFLFP